MNVLFVPKALQYLEKLVIILYVREYFSYLDTSKKYVDELVDEILSTLPEKLHIPAPNYFNKYSKGMKYAIFKKSKRTSWYVFFKKYRKNEEIIYVVRYIANNHIIAQHL